MSESIQSGVVLLVFVTTIVALIRFQKHPARVFGLALLTLFSLNLVSNEQVINAGSNQGLLTLILLMLCSIALEKTRVLRIMAQFVIRPSYGETFARLFGFTVVFSAFLNNTAVVSSLLSPIRNNPHHSATKLLLPLSYAAILGGTLTLIGTSTNLIVNSLLLDTDLPPLSFFDFTAVGLCVVVACGLVLTLLVRFLPSNETNTAVEDSYFIEASVSAGSTLIGKDINHNGLRHMESLFLIEMERNGQIISPVCPTQVLEANDRLFFNGDVSKVSQLTHYNGLEIFAEKEGLASKSFVEAILLPQSNLVNRSLKECNFRQQFNAGVVAIKRNGVRLSGKLGEVKLKAGDFLVLTAGKPPALAPSFEKHFILLSDIEVDNKLQGIGEKATLCSFVIALLCASIGIVSLFKAMLLLFGALLCFGVLTLNDVTQRFPYHIWLIITSAIVMSFAIQNSGLFQYLDVLLNQNDLTLSPHLALVIVFVSTLLLTELVTNNAAAAVTFPIAYSLALSLDANPIAFVMAVAFGASASFISPYGYQTNLMVFNAGQYKLTDFIKIGAPISIIYSFTAILAIEHFFGL
ncbi:transporter [Vibrio sp. UCD-FRSSP16_10]|uniref:SLC13 family permease n=1 Tax=unclassified Vibrio TaxID=2614977 RepID=UPI0008013DC1|nr:MULTISPECIES: SLC13 family permease [unclassified Vibrio]OBT15517.1 transporter [Vibrio sp. UCD-FRSSP16_30]OBT20590.1 transporter [Vibrio sp. UCD-FRSSP16_10]